VRCPLGSAEGGSADGLSAPHDYPRILAQQQRANQTSYVHGLKQQHPEAMAYAGTLPRAGRAVLLAATLRVLELESHCAVLTPAARGASGVPSSATKCTQRKTMTATTPIPSLFDARAHDAYAQLHDVTWDA